MDFNRFLHAIVLSLLLVSLSPPSRVGASAQGTNATLDYCSETSQCRPGLICRKPVGNTLEPCIGFVDDDNPCRCLVITPIDCNITRYACPPGEGCGRHKFNEFQICVSCTTLFDPNSNYSTVKGIPACTSSPTPLPTPSSSPGPPRRKLDLCSDVAICESGLICTGYDGKEVCENPISPCYCFMEGSQGTCAAASDCPNSEETCLRYTVDNSTTCGSCTRLKTDPRYVPAVDDDDSCKGVDQRPVPEYNTETRGLGFDDCFFGKDCVKGHKCAASAGVPCGPQDLICSCQGADYTPVLCNDTSECLSGEVCVYIRGIPPSTCLSLSQYYLAPLSYDLRGEFPPRGNLVTFDDCINDEQCADGLYCTHLTESSLGGCLERRGCACVPPLPVQCSSSDDCRAGESCVRVPDAQQEAQCYSTNALPKDPYFKDLSQSVKPTPTIFPTDGWLVDACRQDSDCKQDNVMPRSCVHFTEFVGSCDGRDMCICKREGGEEAVCKSSKDCGSGETCAIVVDSKKRVNATCISTKVLELDYFAVLYVEVFRSRRAPAITPSNTPSIPPSPSISPSTSTSSSVSPSISATTTPTPTSTASTSPSSSESVSVTASKSEMIDPATIAGQSPIPSEEEEEVCVDVSALTDLQTSDLVYVTSRRAAVLCDEHGSCATAGHMVVWHGAAMMMKTYCERHAKCQRSVREVNSPRMRKNLRITSRTVGLSYTAFAARFTSWLEERLLRSVVHSGF